MDRHVDKHLTEGNRGEFTSLWSDAYPVVAAYVAGLVLDHHQTEEVLSRVAITVVQKFGQYDVTRPFKAWAIGIARFEVLKFRRERARDRHLFVHDLLETIGDRCVALSEERTFDKAKLRECLDQIHGRTALAMSMCYGESLRSEAIAHRLKMKAGAVRTMLHRARDAVRRCLDRKEKETQRR